MTTETAQETEVTADYSAMGAYNVGWKDAIEWSAAAHNLGRDSRAELEKAWLEIAKLESQVLRASKREHGLHECCIDLIDLLPAFSRLPGLDRYKQEFGINSGEQA